MLTHSNYSFTANDFAGAVAAAALHDLRVNNFTFRGFPSVTVEEVGGSFQVFLASKEKTVGPMIAPIQAAKASAKAFYENQEMDPEWVNQVQDLLLSLECAHC